MRKINEIGNKYGSLTVIDNAQNDRHGKTHFLCKCKCGTVKSVSSTYLRSGRTKSCGCLMGSRRETYGRSRSPEYRAWSRLQRRCNNPKDEKYKDYGGRGISVCDRWVDNFNNFFMDMGPRPSNNHSIDRIDNDGNYCKENCRWATDEQQRANKRINYNAVLYTYKGRKMSIRKWSKFLNINYQTLYWRLRVAKMTFKKAIYL